MTDYFQAAQGLLAPQVVQAGVRRGPGAPGRTETLPANPAAAQVHATLAVASQLARIATALERLAGGQESPGPQ
jgi:hypothetical protein